MPAEGPGHAAARGLLTAIVERVLTEDQKALLALGLSDESKELLRGVVHDGLSENAALYRAHAVAELTAVREMLPVGTGST